MKDAISEGSSMWEKLLVRESARKKLSVWEAASEESDYYGK